MPSEPYIQATYQVGPVVGKYLCNLGKKCLNNPTIIHFGVPGGNLAPPFVLTTPTFLPR